MVALDSTNYVGIDEDEALENLLSQLPKGKYRQVIMHGRGGLSVAQRIAYYLDIPVTMNIRNWASDSLFVDDIACTGLTLSEIPRKVDTAVLVHRASSEVEPTFSGVKIDSDKYIKFSWEVKRVN